jgi:hypothetical protein
VISLGAAPPSAAFLVQYNYYCYATHSDGIPVADSDILDGEVYVAGDYIKVGEYGNYGSAAFCADIASATVSARAHSHGVQNGPYSFPSGTGRVNSCRFQDTIHFTVPSGYYPVGVQVTMHGRVRGSLSAEVGAGAQVRCWVYFGDQEFTTGTLEIGVAEEGTIMVGESFALAVELVAPGTTLAQDTVYDRTIDLAIANGHTWSTSYNPGGGSVIGDGDLSFENGLRLTALVAPDFVVCTSESGAFPDLPTPVPDDLAAPPGAQLHRNHPNPFNPRTTISFTLERAGPAELAVLDPAGRRIVVLAARTFGAGTHSLSWDGRDARGRALPSGTYIVRLATGTEVVARKVTLLR